MIVDKRIYTLKPGGVPTYMKIYEEFGYKVQSKHLGKPVGWFFSEVGKLNQITHIWAFDDLADRTKKRAAMQADPDWATYLKNMRGRGHPARPGKRDPGRGTLVARSTEIAPRK